ncbi:REP-associated tyrosine transposase [Stratiformator vulcanicus]|uniref:Transposase IS200 like protein n=1 Tax=Stratiformator vulcanicus TaxID=2527980 RepID=A0A517QY38_9PLAN|nr:transposase [Stratiformator vulcanicus]QDT36508.1 Transposase IS200 like protein [Stratiformator vulcanicus]
MKRRHRRNYNEPGHAHELTFSCFRGLPLLAKDRARQWLAESIDEARQKHDFDLWAYVFMPEHVHLIIHPRNDEYDIAVIRRTIKSPVARKAIDYLEQTKSPFLRRLTRKRGVKSERCFWQSGGGYDRNITEAKALEKMIDYIHLNPVRRELCLLATDWEWSSVNFHVHGTQGQLKVDSIPPDWTA